MLVRELNHRVKNNLQIIVSLMNLRKRVMPPERREDIRFIEEHVQSMSVAYRLVYATTSMVDVSLTELITEVMSGLRHIAGLSEERLSIASLNPKAMIGLDHAVALALYLAVLVPPFLDQALSSSGAVAVDLSLDSGVLILTVRPTGGTKVELDTLRLRLMRAYAEQLNAEILPTSRNGSERLRFLLESSKVATPDEGTETRPSTYAVGLFGPGRISNAIRHNCRAFAAFAHGMSELQQFVAAARNDRGAARIGGRVRQWNAPALLIGWHLKKDRRDHARSAF